MLKLLWHSGFELERIKGCGMNLNENITIPLPQQLSQDLIYVARKGKSENKYYERIKRLREENYNKVR